MIFVVVIIQKCSVQTHCVKKIHTVSIIFVKTSLRYTISGNHDVKQPIISITTFDKSRLFLFYTLYLD